MSAFFTMLRRLVPRRQRHLFEPSYHDLVAEHLSANRTLGPAFRLRAVLLVVQCHLLELSDAAQRWIQRASRILSPSDPSNSGRMFREPHRVPARESRVQSILQDFRYAFRSVVKAPAHTAFVILTLALGIGANVAMFSVTNAALLRALPFPDAARLVMGRATWEGRIGPTVSLPDYRDYRDQSDVFESFAAIRDITTGHTITGGGEPEWVSGTVVSVNLFSTLGIDPQAGRHFTADEGEPGGPNVAIISHGYGQRHFGSAVEAPGASLVIDGMPYTVVGVMPAGFHFLYEADFWTPLQRAGHRNSHSWLSVGRLKPGVTLEQAQNQMDVISARLAESYPETNEIKALLLTELQDALAEDYHLGLLLLTGAIGLVLLIACVNIAGLLLARGSARSRELSVRAALGASRGRLARQLFTESVLVAVAAGTLGVGFASWLQDLVLAFVPLRSLGITAVEISTPMLLFALALSLGTALLFGGAPALIGARANPARDLTGGTRSSSHSGATRLRSVLVVLQVALSLMLLIGSGLLIRSFARLRGIDIGFQTEQLLTADVRLSRSEYPDGAARVQFFENLLGDVRAIPGVLSASAINKLPIRSPWMNWGVWDPDNPPNDRTEFRSAYARWVLPGYFDTMGIPVLAGRDVRVTDGPDTPRRVVISQAMASWFFPNQEAVGREVAVNLGATEPTNLEVIGVVGDARINTVASDPGFAIYFPHAQMPDNAMSLTVRTRAEPTATVSAIRDAVRARNPNVPIANVATMEQIISQSVSASRSLDLMLTLFAVAALLLALIGLYGVLAYHVAQRIHEIGVRIALGASSGQVVQLVLQRGLWLVAAGIGLGVPAAGGATGLLQWELYGVEPTDPGTFIGVSLCFAVVGTVACLIPALRATRVDPLTALQVE
jgi:putative ABC transport system permease protein